MSTLSNEASLNEPANKVLRAAPPSFSWGRLIVEMKLTGLSAMIACHCEPVHYNAEIPFLRLEMPPGLDGLKGSPGMNRLSQALKNYFGENLELEISPGPAAGAPSVMASSKKIDAMSAAHQLIMNDEFVQKMLNDFGGKILTETITVTPPPAMRKPG